MVENANTRFISLCTHATIAAYSAVIAPTQVIRSNTSGTDRYTGNNRATKYTPATTIVAAWISAETGVGPSIASGNHICNGNIADFPAPPINISAIAHDATEQPKNVAPDVDVKKNPPSAVNWSNENVSVQNDNNNIPIKNPKSAKRVTINAFLDADTADGFVQ